MEPLGLLSAAATGKQGLGSKTWIILQTLPSETLHCTSLHPPRCNGTILWVSSIGRWGGGITKGGKYISIYTDTYTYIGFRPSSKRIVQQPRTAKPAHLINPVRILTVWGYTTRPQPLPVNISIITFQTAFINNAWVGLRYPRAPKRPL